MSEKPFNENMAEGRKVGGFKKDAHCSFALFVVHSSLIEKGWIDASFLEGLKHNAWVVIQGFVQNCLTQNVKMVYKNNFDKSLYTMQLLPMYRCKYTSKAVIKSRGSYKFCETLLVFEDP